MKEVIFRGVVVALCIVTAAFIAFAIVTSDKNKLTEIQHQNVVDSLKVEIADRDFQLENAVTKAELDSCDALLYNTAQALSLAQDSIYTLLDEIDVYKYKIERIREYNRIAAQGNNITFLRGWINRVINE